MDKVYCDVTVLLHMYIMDSRLYELVHRDVKAERGIDSYRGTRCDTGRFIAMEACATYSYASESSGPWQQTILLNQLNGEMSVKNASQTIGP